MYIFTYVSNDPQRELSLILKYRQSEIKEFLVNQRPPDSVDVLQGAEPELLQYVGPVVLLQGEGDHGLLHLRLDLVALGDLLQELLPEYLHHPRTEIFTEIKSELRERIYQRWDLDMK